MANEKIIIISRIIYNESFYQMSDAEREKFHASVAEIMGQFGLELVARYKLITESNMVINIFQTASLDAALGIRAALEKINYFRYITGDWDIAVSA